nr:reverse transcriptase domain-containing protein [Tanacetum cinerariifolium]
PEWQRFVTLVKQSQELKHVSYHKFYDILKQHQHEVNEIQAEKIARVANPLTLVAQQQQSHHPHTHPNHFNQNSSTRTHQSATRKREKAVVHIEDKIEGLGQGQVVIQQDFDVLEAELQQARAQITKLQRKQMGSNHKIAFARFRISNLEQILEESKLVTKMPPKRTSTSEAPTMTQVAIKKFIADSVTAALKVQAATMENTIFSYSRCAEENKVTFAAGTLTDDALSWWNAYAKPIGIDQANKGNDLKTYVRRFQELAVLCPNMVPNTEKLLEAFIRDAFYDIKMADENLVSTNTVIKGATLTLLNQPFKIDLMPIKLGSFDIVIGMDLLSKHHAKILCDEKVVHIPINGETLIVRVMEKKKSDEKRIEDIPVVREFPNVFPEDLPGLPPAKIKKLEKRCKPSISHHQAWLRSVSLLSKKKKLSKGKCVLEEPESAKKITKSDFDAAQIARNEEIARQLEVELQAELERERQREEQAYMDYIANLYDEVQARIDADHELAVRWTHEEQEKYTVDERAKFTHSQLNKKNFEEIQGIYMKEQKLITDFVPIRSEEDERMIRDMNKKVVEESSNKDFVPLRSEEDERMIRDMNKKVVEESSNKGVDSTKNRKEGSRTKMMSKTQKTDVDLEEEEKLKTFLKIDSDE